MALPLLGGKCVVVNQSNLCAIGRRPARGSARPPSQARAPLPRGDTPTNWNSWSHFNQKTFCYTISVPGARAAVRGLDRRAQRSRHEHRGVSAPQAGGRAPSLRAQNHNCEYGSAADDRSAPRSARLISGVRRRRCICAIVLIWRRLVRAQTRRVTRHEPAISHISIANSVVTLCAQPAAPVRPRDGIN